MCWVYLKSSLQRKRESGSLSFVFWRKPRNCRWKKNAEPPSVLSWLARGTERVKSHMVAGGIISPGLWKKKCMWRRKKRLGEQRNQSLFKEQSPRILQPVTQSFSCGRREDADFNARVLLRLCAALLPQHALSSSAGVRQVQGGTGESLNPLFTAGEVWSKREKLQLFLALCVRVITQLLRARGVIYVSAFVRNLLCWLSSFFLPRPLKTHTHSHTYTLSLTHTFIHAQTLCVMRSIVLAL